MVLFASLNPCRSTSPSARRRSTLLPRYVLDGSTSTWRKSKALGEVTSSGRSRWGPYSFQAIRPPALRTSAQKGSVPSPRRIREPVCAACFHHAATRQRVHARELRARDAGVGTSGGVREL